MSLSPYLAAVVTEELIRRARGNNGCQENENKVPGLHGRQVLCHVLLIDESNAECRLPRGDVCEPGPAKQ